MSPLRWTLMCILFSLYLLAGGAIFMFFEQRHEMEQNEIIAALKKDVKETLIQIDKDFYSNSTSQEVIFTLQKAKEDVIQRISDVCNVGNLLQSQLGFPGSIKWTYYNSVFFAFTIITTIGYGALTPATCWSKIFVIIYALIGIPINTILLSSLSKYFAQRLVKKRRRIKELNHKQNPYEFFLEILVYLVPGLTVLIFIPSVVFVLLEGWTYLDAVYYSFVTLLTIGFGDFVAAIGHGQTFWMIVYKISLIIWIIFGLGYLLMVLGFISQGMTSKHVKVVIERRLLNTLSSRKEKLTRDIEYMRRVVNELYLIKIKPAYKDDEDLETQFQPQRPVRRRSSFPSSNRYYFSPVVHSLEKPGWLLKSKTSVERSRHSSVAGLKSRRASESNLQAIDKELTFKMAEGTGVKADELLTAVLHGLTGRVVDAVEELKDYDERWQSNLELIGFSEDKAFCESDDDEAWDELEDIVIEKNTKAARGLTWGADTLADFESDDDEPLEQVVVQNVTPMSRNSSFLGVVTGAIRKISSFGRFSSSETPSRKTSRNEQDAAQKTPSSRRSSKFRRSDSFERSKSPVKFFMGDLDYPQLDPQPDLHPMASESRKIRQRRKKNSGGDNPSSRKLSLTSTAGSGRSRSYSTVDVLEEYLTTSTNRRLSCRRMSPPTSPLPLRTPSLADFLTALDKVHAKLNSICLSPEDNLIRGNSNAILDESNNGNLRKSLYSSSGPRKTVAQRRKYGTVVKPELARTSNNVADNYGEVKKTRWGGGRKSSLCALGKKLSKKNDASNNSQTKQNCRNRSSSIF